jgi:hypothetical protein
VRGVRRIVGWVWLALSCGPAVEVTAVGTSSTGPAVPGETSTDAGQSATTHAAEAESSVTAGDAPGSSTDVPPVDSSSEGGVGFIIDPDGGAIGLQCDVWSQDCPRGEKCVPCSLGALEWFPDTCCRPLDPDPAAVGKPCVREEGPWSGLDDCAADSVCWFLDDAQTGTCVAQCEGSRANPECAAGSSCDVAHEGTVILCLPTCDPLAPACGAGRTCAHGTRAGYSDFGHFVCQATAPLNAVAGYGEACSAFGELCDEGLACAWPADVPGCEAARCCTVVGALAAPPACPDPTQSCVAAFPDGDAPPGLESLCYCTAAP